ncbi:hypothetical protein FRC02_004842 [Tulasnella sp. 418]|nr:hypothetical protein FRC02_004842 [Tulasnella sp. 418]
MSWVVGLIRRAIFASISLFFLSLWIAKLHILDFWYTILALVLPLRPIGYVIRPGKPGYRGIWPAYATPGPNDSRSPCPGLNALANHGILPRNGKRLTYKQMSKAIQDAYNLSPTLGDQLTASAYQVDQGRGWIDLHDLNVLGIVQHDASLTRPDIRFCPDQGYPHPDLVDRLLACSTDGQTMTKDDWAYFSGIRRRECQDNNSEYSMAYSFLHKFFSSGNSALSQAVFGGKVADLRCWLAEERIPDGWEPKTRSSYGHTILFAQKDTVVIEFSTDETTPLNLRPARRTASKKYRY